MTEWPVKTLGEVCDFVSGSVTPKPGVKYEVFSVPSFDCGNPELLDGSEIKSSKRPVEPGDVLLCKINPRINRVWRVDRESKNQQIASTEWITLRCRGNVLDVYLQYVLQAPSARTAMIESVTGATGSHTRAKYEIVEELEFSVPPLEEQRRIVALLDAANARVTELTACYEQARTHANNLFASALREALESNPEWPVKVLGEICEVFDDGDWIESKDQASSGVRLIQTGNVGDGEFKDRSEKARFISESTFSRLRCTEIFPGDLLVSRLPDPVGRACLIPDTGSKMITAVDCTIMRPRKDMMLPQFLVSSTQTSAYREQVRAKITGTTRDRISRSNLAEVKVSVPPLEEQKRIVARLDSLKAKTSEMVAAYDAKLTAAMNLRQSILEDAFAGDL